MTAANECDKLLDVFSNPDKDVVNQERTNLTRVIKCDTTGLKNSIRISWNSLLFGVNVNRYNNVSTIE